MRFHFGLGIGHVYSHHRDAQPDLQQARNTVHVVPADYTGVEGDVQEYNSESEEEDDGTSRVEVIGERFGASTESLLEQFGEMYDSDVDLDYEN